MDILFIVGILPIEVKKLFENREFIAEINNEPVICQILKITKYEA